MSGEERALRPCDVCGKMDECHPLWRCDDHGLRTCGMRCIEKHLDAVHPGWRSKPPTAEGMAFARDFFVDIGLDPAEADQAVARVLKKAPPG